MTQKLTILRRQRILVNTDPQRRCYNGCHFSSKLIWSDWEVVNYTTPDKVQNQLEYWRDLNDYAVSQRGPSARCEFKVGAA